MKRFFERRYGIVLHWTFRDLPQPEVWSGCSGMPPACHENLIGLWKWVWWDLVKQRFFIRYELATTPFSHDVLVVRFGPWIVAFRRAGARFQRDGVQHSKWIPVRIKLPFVHLVGHGGWVNEYMGIPPLEDISPGNEDPTWYQ